VPLATEEPARGRRSAEEAFSELWSGGLNGGGASVNCASIEGAKRRPEDRRRDYNRRGSDRLPDQLTSIGRASQGSVSSLRSRGALVQERRKPRPAMGAREDQPCRTFWMRRSTEQVNFAILAASSSCDRRCLRGAIVHDDIVPLRSPSMFAAFREAPHSTRNLYPGNDHQQNTF